LRKGGKLEKYGLLKKNKKYLTFFPNYLIFNTPQVMKFFNIPLVLPIDKMVKTRELIIIHKEY
jgi:hypothetical protein